MENKKISETLEIKLGESNLGQIENPCNEILDGTEYSVSLCKYSRENHNPHVKLARTECMMSDGDQMNKGSSVVYPGSKSAENQNVAVFEGDLGSSRSDEIKVEITTENGFDVLHSHEPGSPTKIEVSGDGINLFVEVFGPLDEFYENNNDLNKAVDHDDNGKNICTFNVGDLVWAKTRTQVWWPGIIPDPSFNPSEDSKNLEKKGSFLVKYYGNPSFGWCSNLEMKPFIDHFEELSRQNNSRNFLGSVEKALFEIGRRVKLNMTCPCIAQESQNKEENSTQMAKISKFDDVRIQFEPTSFLKRIKHIASMGFIPAKTELVVMKNRLSPFYRSIGHFQLPLQLLKPCNNDNHEGVPFLSKKKKRNYTDINKTGVGLDEKLIVSQKSFESRERKRSKYLSYPYASTLVEETKNLEHASEKQSTSMENSQKKGSKKQLVRRIISKADNIDACSSELLNELWSVARDCFNLKSSKYSDSLTRFYYSFRIYAFLDPEKASKHIGNRQEADSVFQMEGIGNVKEFENPRLYTEPVEGLGNVASDKISEKYSMKAKRNTVSKKRGKKVISTGLKSTSDSFGMVSNINRNINPFVINFEQTPKLPQICTIAKPALSETLSFSVDHTQVIPPSTHNGVVSPNITGSNIQVTPDNIPLLNDGVGLTGSNLFHSSNSMFKESESKTLNFGPVPSVQNSPVMGPWPSSCKPERKKRKGKEKGSQVPSVIPDLNGNVLDASSPGKTTLPLGNFISPKTEPKLQSRRNITNDNGSGGPNVKINKVQDLGGGLLLKFSPEFPLPPKETLIATFSRFGLLKESEIQLLDDSTTQIMYQRSSDAEFAFRSLEKNNPFGESLASFNLHCMPPGVKVKKRKVRVYNPSEPVGPSKTLLKTREAAPDLASIKKNVEMMRSALEKAGDGLSPEMRAKLENEIKGFLNKIGSMAGSSSS